MSIKLAHSNHRLYLIFLFQKIPDFPEKLTWEGKFNKLPLAYIMCLKDFTFMGLSNGFLIHPGIKTRKQATQNRTEKETIELIKTEILPEITKFFGIREGCQML